MRAIATPRPYRRAKIIPFPVPQNQTSAKPSGDLRWLLWAALFLAVSIGGEIVSSHLDAQGISPSSASKVQKGKPTGHISN